MKIKHVSMLVQGTVQTIRHSNILTDKAYRCKLENFDTPGNASRSKQLIIPIKLNAAETIELLSAHEMDAFQ